MNEQTEKLPPKTPTSGVITRFKEGDLNFQIRAAIEAAGLGREVVLQWTGENGKVTLTAPGEVQ